MPEQRYLEDERDLDVLDFDLVVLDFFAAVDFEAGFLAAGFLVAVDLDAEDLEAVFLAAGFLAAGFFAAVDFDAVDLVAALALDLGAAFFAPVDLDLLVVAIYVPPDVIASVAGPLAAALKVSFIVTHDCLKYQTIFSFLEILFFQQAEWLSRTPIRASWFQVTYPTMWCIAHRSHSPLTACAPYNQWSRPPRGHSGARISKRYPIREATPSPSWFCETQQ